MTDSENRLMGALIGLVRTAFANPKTEETDSVLLGGLKSLALNEAEENLSFWIGRVHEEKNILSPGCASCEARCGNTDDYDMNRLSEEDTETKALKNAVAALLFRIAVRTGETSGERVMPLVSRMTACIAEEWTVEQLFGILMEAGEMLAGLEAEHTDCGL